MKTFFDVIPVVLSRIKIAVVNLFFERFTIWLKRELSRWLVVGADYYLPSAKSIIQSLTASRFGNFFDVH